MQENRARVQPVRTHVDDVQPGGELGPLCDVLSPAANASPRASVSTARSGQFRQQRLVSNTLCVHTRAAGRTVHGLTAARLRSRERRARPAGVGVWCAVLCGVVCGVWDRPPKRRETTRTTRPLAAALEYVRSARVCRARGTSLYSVVRLAFCLGLRSVSSVRAVAEGRAQKPL